MPRNLTDSSKTNVESASEPYGWATIPTEFNSVLKSLISSYLNGTTPISPFWTPSSSVEVVEVEWAGRSLRIGLVALCDTVDAGAANDLVHQGKPQQRKATYLHALETIKRMTELSNSEIGELLGVGRQTLYFWEIGRGKPSSTSEDRLYAVKHILELAEQRYSGPTEMRAWLKTPQGVEGKSPFDHLKNGDFDRARLLAAGKPTPGVEAPPAWATKPVPAKYKRILERRRLPVPAQDINIASARERYKLEK